MLLFFVSFFNHASPLPEILFIKCRCELHNKKKPPLPLTSFTTTEEDKWKACGILPEVGFNRNLESWIPNPISFPRNLAWRGREGGQGEHSKKQVWSSSTHAAYDVTVFHPLQDATAANEPGHARNFAHDSKLRGAEEECRQQGIAFLPLVAESLAGWHQCAEREVKKLGSALARHTSQLEGEAIAHLWGRLGILLQRGNAAILGNRVPNFPDAQVDGLE